MAKFVEIDGNVFVNTDQISSVEGNGLKDCTLSLLNGKVYKIPLSAAELAKNVPDNRTVTPGYLR